MFKSVSGAIASSEQGALSATSAVKISSNLTMSSATFIGSQELAP
ncbi:hypothetical protein [uncultured Campylobacter sp.]|nr:hypothetical protein [uncultured Campylobacter sp.]